MTMWAPNGVMVSTQSWGNGYAAVASSGADGGVVMAWIQFTDLPYAWRVFAQRMSVAGIPQWTAGGVVVCDAPGIRYGLQAIPDGSGGIIVTWEQLTGSGSNGFDVYVQRVNASGVPLWTTNGVAVSTAPSDQVQIHMVSDGNGGAILAWQDNRPDVGGAYAQRVNAAGIPQWAPGGIRVPSVLASGNSPRIVSDSASGAIITWTDSVTEGSNLYAQRFDAAGVAQWSTDGVALSMAPGYKFVVGEIVSDGAGGAIIAWSDTRVDYHNQDIYAQRVSASGQALWNMNGVPLCTAPRDQKQAVMASDGVGGAIVAWRDDRNGDYDPDMYAYKSDVYAQRVSGTGVPQWTADGVAICTEEEAQYYVQIAGVQDGAIVTWEDERSGHYNYDIYAQHVNLAGIPLWPTDGVALSTAPKNQGTPSIAASGPAGAIVAWVDHQTTPTYTDTVFAQRVVDDGVPPAAVTDLAADFARKNAAVAWHHAGDDGVTGMAVRFQLRTSSTPITEATWAAASIVADSYPGPGGSLECLEVPLSTCSPHYFALKTMDEAENWSAISNVVAGSTTCLGSPIFAECPGGELEY